MRKRYRILLIAAVVAALVVPVGYALSLEPHPPAMTIAQTRFTPLASIVASPVMMRSTSAIVQSTETADSSFRSISDAGKLFLVGTLLFGLSALVRKAI